MQTALSSGLVDRSYKESISRAWDAYQGGSSGGFAVDSDLAQTVWDQARAIDTPLARCRLWPTVKSQFNWPAFNESSRATGSRWGGLKATWRGGGLDRSLTSDASVPEFSLVKFRPSSLIIYSDPLPRDLISDSELVADSLSYAAHLELAFAIVDAMVSGDGIDKPLGVLNAPATIKIARSAANDIKAADITAMWSRLWGPSRSNAVWICSDDALLKIDAAAESFPSGMYFPQGYGGNPYPLLKGRPLLSTEQCPALGKAGDLILADWSQYGLVVRSAPANGKSKSDSPEIEISKESVDSLHGLLVNQIEGASSEHLRFDTEEVVFRYKIRVDGKPMWLRPVEIANGSQQASPFIALGDPA